MYPIIFDFEIRRALRYAAKNCRMPKSAGRRIIKRVLKVVNAAGQDSTGKNKTNLQSFRINAE